MKNLAFPKFLQLAHPSPRKVATRAISPMKQSEIFALMAVLYAGQVVISVKNKNKTQMKESQSGTGLRFIM